MSTTPQTPTALDVPAGSGRPWTEADVAELIRLYEDGGDKACLPMRIIAKRIGRSEAAAWAKLRRACPNFSCARDYGYTGKFLHEMLSRRFHPEGGPINNVIAAEMMLPESGSEHDIVHELMYRIVHEIEQKSEGMKIQGIEVIMQSDPMILRSRVVVKVGVLKPQWQTVDKIGTPQVPEKVIETPQSAPQLADRILPD